jgi:hypothetical protein
MFRRAIICALLTPFGTLTTTAAPLNPELKNTAFQPGTAIKAPLLRPAQSTVWSQSPLWMGVKVRKITPSLHPRTKVELAGIVFTKADEAAARPAPARLAGSVR